MIRNNTHRPPQLQTNSQSPLRIEVAEVKKRRSRSPLKRINPLTMLKAAINRVRQPVIDSLEVRGVPLVLRVRQDSDRPSSFDFAAARGIRDARREFGHHILSDNLAKMERQQSGRRYASSFHNTRASATAGATATLLTTALSQGLIVGLGVSTVFPPAGPIAGAVVVVVSAAAAIAGSRRHQHLKAYNDAKSDEIQKLFTNLRHECGLPEGVTLQSSRPGDAELRKNWLNLCKAEPRGGNALAGVILQRVEHDLKDARRWQAQHPGRTAAPRPEGPVSGNAWPRRASIAQPPVPGAGGSVGNQLGPSPRETREIKEIPMHVLLELSRRPPKA